MSISMSKSAFRDTFSANMEKPNSPYCDCGAGYRGDKCEFDLCNELLNPCVHGNCTHSPDYPYRMECICDPDWTGMALGQSTEAGPDRFGQVILKRDFK